MRIYNVSPNINGYKNHNIQQNAQNLSFGRLLQFNNTLKGFIEGELRRNCPEHSYDDAIYEYKQLLNEIANSRAIKGYVDNHDVIINLTGKPSCRCVNTYSDWGTQTCKSYETATVSFSIEDPAFETEQMEYINEYNKIKKKMGKESDQNGVKYLYISRDKVDLPATYDAIRNIRQKIREIKNLEINKYSILNQLEYELLFLKKK